MALAHIDQLRLIMERGKWDDKTAKHVSTILSDVAVIARNRENHRMKGRLQRELKSATLRRNRYAIKDKDQDSEPWPERGELEIEIATTYSGKSKQKRLGRARVHAMNYGFEVRADGPLFLVQSSCNVVQIIVCDSDEVHEMLAEER